MNNSTPRNVGHQHLFSPTNQRSGTHSFAPSGGLPPRPTGSANPPGTPFSPRSERVPAWDSVISVTLKLISDIDAYIKQIENYQVSLKREMLASATFHSQQNIVHTQDSTRQTLIKYRLKALDAIIQGARSYQHSLNDLDGLVLKIVDGSHSKGDNNSSSSSTTGNGKQFSGISTLSLLLSPTSSGRPRPLDVSSPGDAAAIHAPANRSITSANRQLLDELNAAAEEPCSSPLPRSTNHAVGHGGRPYHQRNNPFVFGSLSSSAHQAPTRPTHHPTTTTHPPKPTGQSTPSSLPSPHSRFDFDQPSGRPPPSPLPPPENSAPPQSRPQPRPILRQPRRTGTPVRFSSHIHVRTILDPDLATSDTLSPVVMGQINDYHTYDPASTNDPASNRDYDLANGPARQQQPQTQQPTTSSKRSKLSPQSPTDPPHPDHMHQQSIQNQIIHLNHQHPSSTTTSSTPHTHPIPATVHRLDFDYNVEEISDDEHDHGMPVTRRLKRSLEYTILHDSDDDGWGLESIEHRTHQHSYQAHPFLIEGVEDEDDGIDAAVPDIISKEMASREYKVEYISRKSLVVQEGVHPRFYLSKHSRQASMDSCNAHDGPAEPTLVICQFHDDDDDIIAALDDEKDAVDDHPSHPRPQPTHTPTPLARQQLQQQPHPTKPPHSPSQSQSLPPPPPPQTLRQGHQPTHHPEGQPTQVAHPLAATATASQLSHVTRSAITSHILRALTEILSSSLISASVTGLPERPPLSATVSLSPDGSHLYIYPSSSVGSSRVSYPLASLQSTKHVSSAPTGLGVGQIQQCVITAIFLCKPTPKAKQPRPIHLTLTFGSPIEALVLNVMLRWLSGRDSPAS